METGHERECKRCGAVNVFRVEEHALATWKCRSCRQEYDVIVMKHATRDEPRGVVCSTCFDTHRMTVQRDTEPKEWPCTYCPTPCEDCRAMGGAYCKATPCACACHANQHQYRRAHRVEVDAPAVAAALERAGTLPLAVSDEELRGVMKRAGVPPHAQTLLLEAPPRSADHREREVWQAARAVLFDAVRESRRWTERVKLLETRIDFAVDVVRGKHDGRM